MRVFNGPIIVLHMQKTAFIYFVLKFEYRHMAVIQIPAITYTGQNSCLPYDAVIDRLQCTSESNDCSCFQIKFVGALFRKKIRKQTHSFTNEFPQKHLRISIANQAYVAMVTHTVFRLKAEIKSINKNPSRNFNFRLQSFKFWEKLKYNYILLDS